MWLNLKALLKNESWDKLQCHATQDRSAHESTHEVLIDLSFNIASCPTQNKFRAENKTKFMQELRDKKKKSFIIFLMARSEK